MSVQNELFDILLFYIHPESRMGARERGREREREGQFSDIGTWISHHSTIFVIFLSSTLKKILNISLKNPAVVAWR